MFKSLLTSACLTGVLWTGCSRAEPAHFDPDLEPNRIHWTRLTAVLGPAPDVHGQRFGAIVKTLTNEYWRLMAAGYRRRAGQVGAKIDIQSAQSESDQTRQLSMLGTMVGSQYKALLISPISSSNLQPALEDANAAGIPVVEVDGAVVDTTRHFVGAVNREMGVSVAGWFIRAYPQGGQVAVITGQAGVFSTVHRTEGFVETLAAAKTFEVVATVSGQWDRKLAYDATLDIIRHAPKLIGIYCNNDTMALGVVDAVKSLHLLHQVRVFGTDGTRGAYASIKAGEMAGTVDIFPIMAGEIGLEVAERLAAGQTVPRVVETPQALVTRDNIARYDLDESQLTRAVVEHADLP